MPAIYATDRDAVVKTVGMLIGIPTVLGLVLVGAEFVQSYNGLRNSVAALQQDVTQGLQELKKQNRGSQAALPDNSELKAEYANLEKQLAEARALNATLEKQLAEATTSVARRAEPPASPPPSAQEAEAAQTGRSASPPPSAQEAETPSEPTEQLHFTKRRYEIGSEGSEVERIQKRLQELEHYSGTVTGVFDDETASAVHSFQTSQELEADGIAGRKTLQLLFPDAQVTLQSGGQASVQNTVAVIEPSEGTESPTVRYTLGSKGPDVERIQKRLQELGHYQGTIDSAYGAETRKAVKVFQRNQGIRADGFIGEKTWLLLFPDN